MQCSATFAAPLTDYYTLPTSHELNWHRHLGEAMPMIELNLFRYGTVLIITCVVCLEDRCPFGSLKKSCILIVMSLTYYLCDHIVLNSYIYFR